MGFKNGDVVWYVEYGTNKIVCGLVNDVTRREIWVEPLYLQTITYINGKPAERYVFPTRWRKLPKGWKYDAVLADIKYRHPKSESEYSCSSNESVLKAIEDGVLVRERDMKDIKLQTEITKDGWRITKDILNHTYRPSYVSLLEDKVFESYDSAKKALDNYLAELKRQSELTDEEWLIEQIDKVLRRGIDIGVITEDEAKSYRERLLDLELKNLDVRLTSSGVQWKYEKKKNWSSMR